MNPILFIINPISGGLKKDKLPSLILKKLDKNIWAPEIRIWTNKEISAFQMAKQALNEGFKAIVAVGGDGTINQVAAALKNSSVPMGIIPQGSGNGLARHLRIPIHPAKAIELLNKNSAFLIDTGLINNNFFLNVAGVGFDALIGYRFAHAGTRGFSTYFKTTIKELFNYKPKTYFIQTDSQEINTKAFLISFANGSQWGNNAFIAPGAKLNDGLLNISILKPFPWFQIPIIAFQIFTQNLRNSKYYLQIPASSCQVKIDSEEMIHFDGEPLTYQKNLDVTLHPKSLLLFCNNEQ